MPWPANLDTALAVEEADSSEGVSVEATAALVSDTDTAGVLETASVAVSDDAATDAAVTAEGAFADTPAGAGAGAGSCGSGYGFELPPVVMTPPM